MSNLDLLSFAAQPKHSSLDQLTNIGFRLARELDGLGHKAIETAGYVSRLQLSGFQESELAVVDGLANGVDHQAFGVLLGQRAQSLFHGLGHGYGNFCMQAFFAAQQFGAPVQHQPVSAGSGSVKRPLQFDDINGHARKRDKLQWMNGHENARLVGNSNSYFNIAVRELASLIQNRRLNHRGHGEPQRLGLTEAPL